MNDTFTGRQIARGTAVTAGLTVVSRFLGFLRDLIVARVFGSGFYADAYFVAFRIPNLLRSFIAEGALSAAFVPLFSEALRTSKEEAQRTLSAVTGFLIAATALLSAFGIFFADAIVSLFAPGFPEAQRELCAVLTRIMLPYIMFVSVIAMLNGALNSLKIFGTSAWAQSVMNVFLIGGGIVAAFLPSRQGVIALSVSVLLGGVAQVVFQVPAMRRAGLALRPAFRGGRRIVTSLLALMLPAVFGAAIYQIGIFLNTLFASRLEPGSVSWLFYADRLVQLPIGIFSIALASVLLPALSHAAAADDTGGFDRNLIDSLRYTSFVIIPVAALLFALAEPLVALLFERGAFTAYSTGQTAAAVRGYCIGIWAASCHSMLVRAFMAAKQNRIPTLIGLGSLVVTVLLSIAFMGSPDTSTAHMEFREISQASILAVIPRWEFGHAGLALASSFGSIFAFVASALLLGHRRRSLDWAPFVRSTIKTVIAAGAAAAGISAVVPSGSPGAELAVRGIIGAGIFLIAAYVLRIPELREAYVLISRRLGRERNPA